MLDNSMDAERLSSHQVTRSHQCQHTLKKLHVGTGNKQDHQGRFHTCMMFDRITKPILSLFPNPGNSNQLDHPVPANNMDPVNTCTLSKQNIDKRGVPFVVPDVMIFRGICLRLV